MSAARLRTTAEELQQHPRCPKRTNAYLQAVLDVATIQISSLARRLATMNPGLEADDLSQEALYRLLVGMLAACRNKQLQLDRTNAELAAYTINKGKWRILDVIRERRALSVEPGALVDLLFLQDDHLASMLKKESVDRALATLAGLPPNDRQIIVLHLLRDHDFGTIADMLDVNRDTARQRFKRALDRLRTALQRKTA